MNFEDISSRTKKKFFEEKHVLESSYYKSDNDLNIVTVGDLHYHEHVDKQIFKMLLCHIIETNPDFIVIPGDLIETRGFLNSAKEKEFFEDLIREMGEVAPVIMVPGNHEIANFDTKFNRNDSNDTIKYMESLNKFKNIYFLNNESVKFDNAVFLGFNPRLEYYFKYGSDEGKEIIQEDYLKSGLRMADCNYNILLSHITPEVFQDMKKTDLVISGHWHDGYLPKKFDKFLGDTNVGLFFTPLVAPVPGIVCRGVHDFGRGYLFITQGFRKWTADIKLFNAFEKITANDVEKLTIKKSIKRI